MQTVCKECGKLFSEVLKHVKTHNLSAEEYVLKWFHGGIIPVCQCGCGKQTNWHTGMKNFTRFIHGHHARIRVRSEEERQKIGRKNAAKMKQYMKLNPEIAIKRIKKMKESFSENANLKRSISLKQFYSSDKSKETKKFLSNHATKLSKQNKIGMSSRFKQGYVLNPFTGKEEFMHSSWEKKFLSECILKNYHVTKEHGITIQYLQDNGCHHTYIPDFFSEIHKTIYEIKGFKSAIDSKKWEAAQKYCDERKWKFVVLDRKKFLKNKDILL